MKTIHQKLALIVALSFLIISCKKEITRPEDLSVPNKNGENGHLQQTKTFSSEVVTKWIDIQLRIMRTSPTNAGGLAPTRWLGYSGIALYESVVPGMPDYQSIASQLNGLAQMPSTTPGHAYHWAAVANASLAKITRSFFPTTSPVNLAAIDSLETALETEYRSNTVASTVDRSVTRGREVAQLVLNWALTDGASAAGCPFTPGTAPGSWVPTAAGPVAGPCWGNNRLMVIGSQQDADPAPPIPFSAVPGSSFYNMANAVFSQTLTPEKIAIAKYYRDNPGYGSGHYVSLLKYVLQEDGSMLDKAAIAFSKAGIAVYDAGIGCFKAKYQYQVMRPVTYIQTVMSQPTWTPQFGTPNHPEYPSGHSTLTSAFAEAMTNVFGDNFSFTNHTYDYLGMAPRTYSSFNQMSDEIGDSRVYAGIHYSYACTEGQKQGKKVASNIISRLQYLK